MLCREEEKRCSIWGYTVNDFSVWKPFTLFEVLIFFPSHPNSSIDGLVWSSKPQLAGTCWPVVIWSGEVSLSCGKLITSSQCSLWLECTEMQPNMNWWPCNWFLCIDVIKDEWQFWLATESTISAQVMCSFSVGRVSELGSGISLCGCLTYQVETVLLVAAFLDVTS